MSPIQRSRNQSDQIGRFLKVLLKIMCAKVAQLFKNVLGYFEKHPFEAKTTIATIWAALGKIWATFSFEHLVTLVSLANIENVGSKLSCFEFAVLNAA